MLAYVDSSVLLRIVLAEPHALKEFREINFAVSSELIRVECLRTMDRYRVQASLSEEEYLSRVGLVHDLLAEFELIKISSMVLNRACHPFPVRLGTLDAIHLSSCLLYGERAEQEITLCSHDESLKRAARSLGLAVLG